mmetsp:Transcript_36677/g.84592  ORF Transcript_36677/g.84592 Transcript_36677/m.84592 type:complete len:203 (-) Transcript_36677:160-768(-)
MDSRKMTRKGAASVLSTVARYAASKQVSRTFRRLDLVVLVASKIPMDDTPLGAARIHCKRRSQQSIARRSRSCLASALLAEKKLASMPALPDSRRNSPALKHRTRTPRSFRCRTTAPDRKDLPLAGRPTKTKTTASLETTCGSARCTIHSLMASKGSWRRRPLDMEDRDGNTRIKAPVLALSVASEAFVWFNFIILCLLDLA